MRESGIHTSLEIKAIRAAITSDSNISPFFILRDKQNTDLVNQNNLLIFAPRDTAYSIQHTAYSIQPLEELARNLQNFFLIPNISLSFFSIYCIYIYGDKMLSTWKIFQTNTGTFSAAGENLKINTGTFSATGESLKINTGTFSATGENLKINTGTFSAAGESLKINVGTFSAAGETIKTNVGKLSAAGETIKINVGNLSAAGENNLDKYRKSFRRWENHSDRYKSIIILNVNI